MNNHAKRLCTALETIDFRRDYEAEKKTNARRVYRHANDMAQAVKVFDCMNDSSITMALRLANKIADTGWSGPRQPATIKERATVTRRKMSTQLKREQAAIEQRARDAEAKHEAQERERIADQRRREFGSLMQPGRGR